MTGAMYAAVSGLKTHMSAMNVISNNISNVNTLAYKATRYTFNEALYTTVRSGSNGNDSMGGQNPAQVGYGCSVGTIDLDMSTKNYNPTGQGLDVMIDGDGFFVVGTDKTNNGITTQSQLQGMKLSRLGNFTFDPNGYLVDGNGSLVYGFLRMMSVDDANADAANDGSEEMMCSPVLTPIRYPNCVISSVESEDEADGESQSTQKVQTTILWPKIDDNDGSVRDGSVGDAEDDAFPEGSVATRLQPNSVSIDKTGCITAITKDEKLVVVGYVALASVDSPNGVTHVDGRYYQALGGAGNVHLTTVGGAFTHIPGGEDEGGGGEEEGGLGTSELTVESAGGTALVTGGLESSGTDLAQEITNMIVIQRGYQANTRIVTVTDSMLEELVNMKR